MPAYGHWHNWEITHAPNKLLLLINYPNGFQTFYRCYCELVLPLGGSPWNCCSLEIPAGPQCWGSHPRRRNHLSPAWCSLPGCSLWWWGSHPRRLSPVRGQHIAKAKQLHSGIRRPSVHKTHHLLPWSAFKVSLDFSLDSIVFDLIESFLESDRFGPDSVWIFVNGILAIGFTGQVKKIWLRHIFFIFDGGKRMDPRFGSESFRLG